MEVSVCHDHKLSIARNLCIVLGRLILFIYLKKKCRKNSWFTYKLNIGGRISITIISSGHTWRDMFRYSVYLLCFESYPYRQAVGKRIHL